MKSDFFHFNATGSQKMFSDSQSGKDDEARLQQSIVTYLHDYK
jgi:hypothetical protein